MFLVYLVISALQMFFDDYDDDDLTTCVKVLCDIAVKYVGGTAAERILPGEMAKAAAAERSFGGVQHSSAAVIGLGFDMAPTDGGGVEDELERLRHRNVSGSLSSHDYEELSTSSASLRSTPTYEHRSHSHHSLQLQHLVHSPRVALDFEGNRCTARS